jgi:hypothetical protein
VNALRIPTLSVKAHCASATDNNGNKGPFGKTTVQIMLNRNGHGTSMGVPDDFKDKPAGTCVMNAFKNLQYPPFDSASVTITWDVEVPEKP